MLEQLPPDSVFDGNISGRKESVRNPKTAKQMQFVGEMAAGLAHEIRNPITGIKGALEIFHRELDLSKEDRAVFEEMLFQVKKLEVITRSFLEYARPSVVKFASSNVNEVIRDSLAFVTRYNLHKNIHKVSIIEEFDESAPSINADPLQLQQVFLNLTLNALDAMTEGGTLRYRTTKEGNSVIVEVSEIGYTLGRDSEDRASQPFFTTGARGLGVGLSVSRRLIEQHGGDITVESGEKGTAFRARLPLVDIAADNQIPAVGSTRSTIPGVETAQDY